MKENDIGSKDTNSPKTPGGISKALLTPIRRLGLSRKWKKSSISPFVSPLAGNSEKINKSDDDVIEEKKSKKRRLCVDDENINISPIPDVEREIISLSTDSKDTPVKKALISRKKSKLFTSNDVNSNICKSKSEQNELIEQNDIPTNVSSEINNTVTEKFTSNSCVKELSPDKSILNSDEDFKENIINEDVKETIDVSKNVMNLKTPNNLTTECIVVLQNKIKPDKVVKKHNSRLQVGGDSDSDDMPLSHINNKDKSERKELEEDLRDDLPENSKNSSVQPIKRTKSTSSKKSNSSTKKKTKKANEVIKDKIKSVQSSQSSNSFEDDDDFEVKKTIIIRKSYDKIAKPKKAKSTGSITQKDIDEIKARIEMKKKLLLAKAMGEDTEELRALIKKWQKGCQLALMELLELMKKKLPDQKNMDYSYILEMLKIPPTLVGYDCENDCFNTPDDNSILAAAFNDL
ncbi:uncharacterized protein DDB_G0284459-like [Battus philenor]|uniref:uncharacterized protein DDB_G0284459-like n=1 Tax=Battus philenor TaxID=42288 RepID=UPI0035D09C25